jgi:hypothetical protein
MRYPSPVYGGGQGGGTLGAAVTKNRLTQDFNAATELSNIVTKALADP